MRWDLSHWAWAISEWWLLKAFSAPFLVNRERCRDQITLWTYPVLAIIPKFSASALFLGLKTGEESLLSHLEDGWAAWMGLEWHHCNPSKRGTSQNYLGVFCEQIIRMYGPLHHILLPSKRFFFPFFFISLPLSCPEIRSNPPLELHSFRSGKCIPEGRTAGIPEGLWHWHCSGKGRWQSSCTQTGSPYCTVLK